MEKIQVLIVDDEFNMRNLLRIHLVKNGFEVTEAKNGQEALEFMGKHSFDMIILDVMMPYMDGWEVCAKIREKWQTPILMLTARTETKDKVKGLNMGADDYLIKPFDPEELMARIFALFRRTQFSESGVQQPPDKVMINYKDLMIDPEGREVQILDQSIDLTPKEFDLLHILASLPGRAFSRENLLEKIWGDYFGDQRTVDTHVKNIRDKVRKAGLSYNPIQTVWGVGYKFQGTEK
jgi:two-component system response regulator ResD